MPYAWVVGLLHMLGIASLLVAITHHPSMLGLGVLAYTFGLRHAYDIDHIAAIDNTVRKLIQQGKRSAGVGFYFSLGHSSVVFIMSVVTVLAVKWFQETGPTWARLGGIVGTSVSGVFLILIGMINLVVLIEMIRYFRARKVMSAGDEKLEKLLQSRGFFSRLIGKSLHFVSESWQIYPIGFLFGLGFDTATEVALLAVSVEASSQAVPFVGMISLPLLFAAGMSLMDTADGVFMGHAYRFALTSPIRKMYYNLMITGISVAMALLIGLMEIGQLIAKQFGLHGGLWDILRIANLGSLGYVFVGLFLVVWLLSYGIWKVFRIEERWNSNVAQDL